LTTDLRGEGFVDLEEVDGLYVESGLGAA